MVSVPVKALPTFLPIVKETYKFKAGGNIDKSSCTLCHLSSGPPKLNPYGTALKPLLQNKTLTEANLKAIDNQDSDGDGFPNSAEFAADTLPGDPASKPAGPPPSAKSDTVPAAGAKASDETNIWDLKTLMFPKHAQHRVIVHFPIALLIFSLFFDIVGMVTKNRQLMAAGYFNLIASVVTAPIAVVTGLLAWYFAFGGMPLTQNMNLLYHLITGTVTMFMTFVLFALRRKVDVEAGPLSGLYIALGLLALLLVAVTGHIGGGLVG
jgi:uncharacterized membrane protein